MEPVARNITHVVENLERGGLERSVIDLVRAQLARGHRCQVVCLFERGALAAELDALGVPVQACGKRRGFDLRALLRARRAIVGHRTDVLHTHNATAHYHAVLAAIGVTPACTINTRHGMGALDAGSRRERLYRLAMRWTDFVVTVCRAAGRELEQAALLPAGKLRAIPNGIRIERFAPANAQARAMLVASLGLPPKTRLVGTVGRLNWAKDHAGLIRAFADLHRRTPDCALVIVGDGPLRDDLRVLARSEAIAGSVFLLGDRSDVEELLCGFDVFALSSLTEGYSIALLEACAAALPIVATDVGGNAEIVHAGINGLLVPARSPRALADAVYGLLADPVAAAAMGRAGRDWVLEEGSFTAMAARYDALHAERVAGDR